jgi:hypothetical protein
MKKQILPLLASIAVLLFFLTACQKEVSVPNQDEAAGTPLPGQTTYCRIESIWEDPHAPDQRFFLVGYNEFENPTFVSAPLPSTGHPFRVFEYDHWNRLREYRGEYGNGLFEFWHFYGFDNNGRIGVDTNYVFGTLGEQPTDYFNRSISQITYDNWGRIIKVTTTYLIGTPTEENYSYDASGNLIYPAAWGITYDNKQNLNRTNDIWQFLNKDYSMNNPFMADAYNTTGFPTIINTTSMAPSMTWLQEVDLRRSQISYNCRPAFF